MDRLKQKNEIYVKLGMLFGPLRHIADNPDAYDEQEKAYILARYFADYPELNDTFRVFCKGQPGHNYAIEYEKFFNALYGLKHKLERGIPLVDAARNALQIAQSAVDAVPIPKTSIILEAGSPFKAYCKLRELCESDATKSITWLDPFMGVAVFHRFITHLRTGVVVRLVTSEPNAKASRRDQLRWAEFLDISKLYAMENGSQFYSLIVNPSLHDRWVVFDEKRIYALGGSAKDAGNKDYFTITSVESSAENNARIDHHISTGQELFGMSNPTHP